jgi:hypothetical protein
MNLAENWCSGASFHALLWLGATPSILWVRCENNCWSSDDIESSLIDYSISTNKDEYDFFYGKVKEIGTTVHGFCYRGLWRTYRVEPVKQTDKLERSEPITRPASDGNASMLIVQLHQLRIKNNFHRTTQ